jgi:hypothetical protein
MRVFFPGRQGEVNCSARLSGVRSPHEKRNVAVLFVAQALLGAQGAVHIILGGLAGALLASNQAYATLIIAVLAWLWLSGGRRAHSPV